MSLVELMSNSDWRSDDAANMGASLARDSIDAAETADSPGDRAEDVLVVTDSRSPSPKQVDLPACRQSDQKGISDPLPMPPESGKVDAAAPVAAETHGADADSSSLGLSQVLGKILQQLSISAWVPAAMLVGNGAVLLQLHADADYNFAGAVKELAGKPLGTIIILAFSLILATVVTQAFEFEVIRFLEGYFDSANGLIQSVLAWRIRRHESKRDRLKRILEIANTNARKQAVERMKKYPAFDSEVLAYLAENPPKASKSFNEVLAEKAGKYDWRRYAPPAAGYRIDSTNARFSSYPAENRVLPTRLGNVLRAVEDEIKLGENENLEGYVVRHHNQLPAALQSQHKDYRTRLDMYCSLTLAFSMLIVVSIATLNNVSPLWGMAIAVIAYALMACLSYQAAIASARSYGLILREIPQYLARQEALTETGESSPLTRFLALLHRNAV